MTKPTKKFTLFRRENAQTMVEFALVFPIVLLITYGIMEMGRMIFIYTALTSAAREGARYGVATGIGVNGFEQYADCSGIRTAVRKAAFLMTIPNDANIEIKYLDDHSNVLGYTCANIQANPKLIKQGYQIQVRVFGLQFEPLIGRFLGISSFTIKDRVNTRTILMDVKIEK